MTIDLTPILQAVIALAVALISHRLIPWIKTKTTNEQQRSMSLVINTLVYAAEQIYGPGGGKGKLDFVAKQLEERGYKVDIEAIEAAVRRMNTESGEDVEIVFEEVEADTEENDVPDAHPPDTHG